jgi:hypothetical protein
VTRACPDARNRGEIPSHGFAQNLRIIKRDLVKFVSCFISAWRLADWVIFPAKNRHPAKERWRADWVWRGIPTWDVSIPPAICTLEAKPRGTKLANLAIFCLMLQ